MRCSAEVAMANGVIQPCALKPMSDDGMTPEGLWRALTVTAGLELCMQP